MKRIHGTAEADFIQINGRSACPQPDRRIFPGSCPPVFPLHKAPLIGDIDFLPPGNSGSIRRQRRLSLSQGKKRLAPTAFAVYKAVESEQMLQNAFFFPKVVDRDLRFPGPESFCPLDAASFTPLPFPVDNRPWLLKRSVRHFRGAVITFPRSLPPPSSVCPFCYPVPYPLFLPVHLPVHAQSGQSFQIKIIAPDTAFVVTASRLSAASSRLAVYAVLEKAVGFQALRGIASARFLMMVTPAL